MSVDGAGNGKGSGGDSGGGEDNAGGVSIPGGDGALGGFGGGPFRVLKDPEINFKLNLIQIEHEKRYQTYFRRSVSTPDLLYSLH